MTVFIQPGKEDCFYQNVLENEKIEIEYQVIDGGFGELDITFNLADPTGRILSSDYKKAENNHRVDAKMTGDYKFCFDNSFSVVTTKTIFFELVVEKDGDDDDEWNDENAEQLPEEVLEITVDEINESINKVRQNLKNIKHLQDTIKNSEARDRNVAEDNYLKVNYFSSMHLFVMVSVSIIQVLVLKSLFDAKFTYHKLVTFKMFMSQKSNR